MSLCTNSNPTDNIIWKCCSCS